MGAPGPGPAEPLSGRRPCPQGHVSGPEVRLLQSTLGRVCLSLRGQAVSVAGARVFSHRGERESPRVGLGAESDSGLGWTLLKLGGVRVGRALGSLREARFLGEGCGEAAAARVALWRPSEGAVLATRVALWLLAPSERGEARDRWQPGCPQALGGGGPGPCALGSRAPC